MCIIRQIMTLFLFLGSLSFFAEEVTIVGNNAKPPKVFQSKAGPNGILIEILKYADPKLKQNFNYQLFPWKRAYYKAQKEKVGIIGISKNNERLKVFDYSAPVYYDDLLLVVRKDKAFKFKNIEDLTGKTVGVLRGASFGELYEQSKEKIFKVSEDNNSKERLLKLLAGRIDVALIGPGKSAVNFVINSDPRLIKGRDKFVILEKPFVRDPNYLAFSKNLKMTEFLEAFNKVIEEGYTNGDIPNIIKNFEK